jgi:hypothetical protein
MTAVDLGRLERALDLSVELMGDGRLLVTGGSAPHVVDPGAGVCDCGDHQVRGGWCKHLLAAELRRGNETVIRALAPLLAAVREEALADEDALRDRLMASRERAS